MAGQDEIERPKTRRILDAAASVFARRGFGDARMDDVAGEAGVSKGGLYLHFKSKDDLFDALVGYLVGIETRKLARARVAKGPVADRLMDFFHGYALDIESMERLYPVFLEVYARASRHETVRRMLQRYLDAYVVELSKLVTEGIASGEFRQVDPDEIAMQLICLLEGLALVTGIDPQSSAMSEHADRGVRLVLDGLLVQPAHESEGHMIGVGNA